MWRTPLCHCDLHARPVDLLCVGWCRARTCNIPVVDFHECRAERQVVCASRIARSETDVPIITREAFIVARGIVVRLELDRNAEVRSECVGDSNRNGGESSIRAAGHQDRVRNDQSGAQFCSRSQCCDGRCSLRPPSSQQRWQHCSACSQMKKSSAGKFHVEPSKNTL